MGRKRLYGSPAERQKAYRERLKSGKPDKPERALASYIEPRKGKKIGHHAGYEVRPEEFERFLEELRSGAQVIEACRVIARDQSTMYQHRKRNPEFAERWEEAWEQGTQVLEQEATRRGRGDAQAGAGGRARLGRRARGRGG